MHPESRRLTFRNTWNWLEAWRHGDITVMYRAVPKIGSESWICPLYNTRLDSIQSVPETPQFRAVIKRTKSQCLYTPESQSHSCSRSPLLSHPTCAPQASPNILKSPHRSWFESRAQCGYKQQFLRTGEYLKPISKATSLTAPSHISKPLNSLSKYNNQSKRTERRLPWCW